MPLPLTVSCFSQIQTGFAFLVPAHPGSPGQRAVRRVCVCVCVYSAPACTVARWFAAGVARRGDGAQGSVPGGRRAVPGWRGQGRQQVRRVSGQAAGTSNNVPSNPNSCLNYLLPPKRDTSLTSRLRAATPYPRPTLRTKKYCSFINYGLSHY